MLRMTTASLPVALLVVLSLVLVADARADAFTLTKRDSIRAHTAKVRGFAFAPDGKLLVSAGDDRTARFWQLGDGTLKPDGELVRGHTSAAFSPDGKTLYIGRGNGVATVAVWDVPAREMLRTINTGHGVETVTVSPDGRHVVTGAFLDPFLRVWDSEMGDLLQQLTSPAPPGPGADDRVRPMGYSAFSPDGKYLAGCVASPSHLCIPTIWDAKTWEIRSRFLAHDLRAYSLLFAPDAKTLAIGTQGGTVKLWNIPAAVKAWDDRDGGRAAPERIVQLIRQLDDDDFQIREAAQKALVEVGAAAEPALRNALKASDSDEFQVRAKQILEAVAGAGANPLDALKPEAVLADEQVGGVRSLAFTPDGRLLAAGSWLHESRNGQLTVWDLSNPQKPLLDEKTMGVEAVAFSPDGETFVTGMFDGSIVIWDVAESEK